MHNSVYPYDDIVPSLPELTSHALANSFTFLASKRNSGLWTQYRDTRVEFASAKTDCTLMSTTSPASMLNCTIGA